MLSTTNYFVMERLSFLLKFEHYTGGEGNITCFKTLEHYLEIFYDFEWL